MTAVANAATSYRPAGEISKLHQPVRQQQPSGPRGGIMTALPKGHWKGKGGAPHAVPIPSHVPPHLLPSMARVAPPGFPMIGDE